jgi:hypothetical protein
MLGIGVTVRVTGPDGSVTAGPPTVKAKLVTQRLQPNLTPGAYRVTWRVASGDGHPISGASSFTVAAAAATPQADPTTDALTTPAPTPEATALATPAPTGGESDGTALPTVLAAGVGVLAVGTGAVLAFARRRRTVDRS